MFVHCVFCLLQGTDNFGFPMLLDMYALLLSPQEREKGRLPQKIKGLDEYSD